MKDETARMIAETNNQTQKRIEAIKARVKSITELSKNELDTIAVIA